uniref:Galectin n=1 Tax=Hadrurus spadix TaxID=141984 RepID=A0A1W7RAH5_9SCOR
MSGWIKVLDNAVIEKGIHFSYSKVPFESNIPGGLVDGRKIFLHAFCPSDASRFSVNFQVTSDAASDIAFHLNPRFDEGDVVMNSRTSDEWGGEERTGKLPFRQMSQFLICITTLQQGYEVEINDEYMAVFDHRIPYDKVTSIRIEGDINIIGLHILNNELRNQNKIPIAGGVDVNQCYTIFGRCNSDFSGFYLNLQCGNSDEDDIALHFNPRAGANEVVRNSYISGSWGDEEKDGDFPFSPGEEFTICIEALVQGFKVRVRGSEFTMYNHRLPMQRICNLVLGGDAKLGDVRIENPCCTELPAFERIELIEPPTPAKLDMKDFKPGCTLNVIGKVHEDPLRFKINLQSGPDEENDIMLHINPRWDQGEPKIVLNSREGGDWADEEMWSEAFPFQADCGFEISIICENDGYRIIINGFEQIFKHRIDCCKVSHAFINGCVDLRCVRVC